MAVHEGVAAVPLGVVERAPMLKCRPRCGELAAMKCINTHRSIRFDQQFLIMCVLGKL